MSVLYVGSVGQTAALHRNLWEDAKRMFKYDEAIMLCSENFKDDAIKLMDASCNLVLMNSQFHGAENFKDTVVDMVKQVMDIVKSRDKRGLPIPTVVINTAGGTEKMSCIMKDVVEVLKRLLPDVKHIWGARPGYETVYTVKPELDLNDICEKFMSRCMRKAAKKKKKPQDKKWGQTSLS